MAVKKHEYYTIKFIELFQEIIRIGKSKKFWKLFIKGFLITILILSTIIMFWMFLVIYLESPLKEKPTDKIKYYQGGKQSHYLPQFIPDKFAVQK